MAYSARRFFSFFLSFFLSFVLSFSLSLSLSFFFFCGFFPQCKGEPRCPKVPHHQVSLSLILLIGTPGVNNKVLYGEAPPRGLTPYPVIYHFNRKGTPFTYQVQNFASFFNCCKMYFLLNMIKSQNQLTLLSFLKTYLTDFHSLSYTSTSEIPFLPSPINLNLAKSAFGRSLLI